MPEPLCPRFQTVLTCSSDAFRPRWFFPLDTPYLDSTWVLTHGRQPVAVRPL